MIAVPALASAVLAGVVSALALRPGRVRRLRNAEHQPPATPDRARQWRSVTLHRRPATITPAAVGGWADQVARSLRHGSTLRAALLAVVPDDEVLSERSAPLRHRLERGAGVAEACGSWADELHRDNAHSDVLLAAFATTVGAAAHLGGSASTPLERFAVVMRQRVSDEMERGAQSAQAKMSARVLTMVPVAVLALLVVTDGDVRRVLTEPAGASVVGVGLALNAVGGWWMRRIVELPTPGGP